MPFVSGYTHSLYARGVPLPVWVPDSSTTAGLSFWIDANDASSYTEYTSNEGFQFYINN